MEKADSSWYQSNLFRRLGVLISLTLLSTLLYYSQITAMVEDLIPVKGRHLLQLLVNGSSGVKLLEKENPGKVILGWNQFAKMGIPPGDAVFKNLKCPVNNCIFTHDRSLFNKSDAVIFRVALGLPRPPLKRPTYHQYWIFLILESPWHHSHKFFKGPVYRQQFNWTMTYRLDSDFYFPFGYDLMPLLGKKAGQKRNLTSVVEKKPKGIAWIVSHCRTNSKRENYVQELQKYIKVDQFGRCGPRLLPKKKNDFKDTGNLQHIAKSYLFYIAFENSLCVDYITEKFFKVLPFDIIPIVRSGGNYSKVVPHKWYIDTADFDSPKHLAQYIQYLQGHPEEAAKYLERRDEYNFQVSGWQENQGFCDLCEKLNNPQQPQHIYNDIYKYWTENTCTKIKDL